MLATVPLPSHADIGITYGSRHNYAGGGSTNLCLKNAAGDQGGVRQGGQDSNDMVVPLRHEHANYNNLPSRNNMLKARNGWNIPCAKCKYAKSCFNEAGVAECPSGYHKMYTGYMHGGHEGHHGNNDRFCLDKNPADDACEGYTHSYSSMRARSRVYLSLLGHDLAVSPGNPVWVCANRLHTLTRLTRVW